MNLTTLLRNHPDLAELLGAIREHLVSCHDCGQRFPRKAMYPLDDGTVVCEPCFDQIPDMEWQEWYDRLAKEGRE